LAVLVEVAEAVGAIRDARDEAGRHDREAQGAGQRGREGVGVLTDARNGRRDFVVLVRGVRGSDAESTTTTRRRRATADGRVLVVALRVDPVAGRRADEVTVEAVRSRRGARRDLHVVGAGGDGAWGG